MSAPATDWNAIAVNLMAAMHEISAFPYRRENAHMTHGDALDAMSNLADAAINAAKTAAFAKAPSA